MRRPRNIDKYVTKEEAAAFLRGVAARVERQPAALAKVYVDLRCWDESWLTPPKPKKK